MFIPKDVSDAFLPLTITNWILGVGVIECPLGRPRVVLSAIYSKMCFFLTTICSFMYKQKFEEYLGDKENSNVKAFLFIFSYGNTFFFFIVIFMEMIYRKELELCYQKINSIDREYKNIGIQEDYSKLLMKHTCLPAFLVTLTVICQTSIYVSSPRVFSADICFLRGLMFYFLLNIPCVIEMQFMSIISYLGKKFKQLNDLLCNLSGCDLCSSQYAKVFYYKVGLTKATSLKLGKKTKDDLILMRKAKEIHLELVKISRTINKIFGLQILISLTISLAILTVASYQVFCIVFLPLPKGKQKTAIILLAFLFCIYAGKVIAVSHVCYVTCEEALNTENIICELHEPSSKAEFRMEIEQFLLQLMQNRLKFTAHGFFTLNHSFIQSVVGMITNYLIMIVQLRSGSKKF